MIRLRIAPVLIAVAVIAGATACSETSQQNIFEPQVGHPETWVVDHGSAALSDGDSCPDCHGTDLGGGVSGLSCFTLSFNEGGCHESGGEARHTTGWALPGEHGRAAKSRPGVSSGMGSCRACHGLEYEGGTSEIACSKCHGGAAPHPPSPWLDSFSGHDSVHELNAPFCSDCHRSEESLDSDGCFNGSLCHGDKGVHAADWALAENHGSAAMASTTTGGFGECSICHGEDFTGGTSGISCSPCHGLDAPHPGEGWLDKGTGHHGVHEDNAPACATCHTELASPPVCFSANGCHDGVTEDPLPAEDPDPADEPPGGRAPPGGRSSARGTSAVGRTSPLRQR